MPQPSLEQIATTLLLLLAKIRREKPEQPEVNGAILAEITRLPPSEINDAITLLQRAGFVEWHQVLGTAPYIFGRVWVTPVGRYEAERLGSSETTSSADGRRASEHEPRQVALPPTPIGSPYGFREEDWEFIAEQKAWSGSLVVVFGYQFKSAHYDPSRLRVNVEATFRKAVDRYNSMPGAIRTNLDFRTLAAGYGEHLFNEIARDIIASDIAVFETSDLNPNVMLELGVALTWGVRVLPIKLDTQPRPPSDISGQTWADYRDSAAEFVDVDHDEKLLRMVERATRKKG